MTVTQLFNVQTKTIAFAAGVLVLSSFISRGLGIVRNGLLSWRFGAGETTDIYLAAFRIPDFIYGILIMGGLSAIFLPMFAELFERNNDEAWRFVNNLLHIFLLGLLVLSAVAFVAAPLLVDIIAPGFSPYQQEVTTSLTRLMLLSPLLLGVSSLFSGVLQYFGKFVAYSLAPIVYNVGIIAGILFLVPLFGIWGLGLGVVIGAFLHLVIQIPPALNSGFRWQPVFHVRDVAVGRVFMLAVPRTIAAAGLHINLIVMTAFASLISAGSITIFTYANDIQHFPVGLIGVPFATAAFPLLSRYIAGKDAEQFRRAFATTLRQIIFLAMPISVLLFLLRAQIVRLAYGTGTEFTWDDTRLTAAVLGVFAFGILFQTLIPFFARTFFSTHNTKTPTMIGLMSVAFNIAVAFFLLSVLATPNLLSNSLASALKLQGIDDIRVLALPLALTISGIVQAKLLALFLRKYVREILQRELYVSLAKTLAASAALAGVTYGILQLYGGIFPLTTYQEVLGQFLLAGVGGVVAFTAAGFFIRSPEALYFWGAVKRKVYGR